MVCAVGRVVRFGMVAALVCAALCLLAAGASATTFVTSGADHGAGSLRAAIAEAPAGEVIVLGASTVKLETELVIAKSLTIDGSGPATSVISGAGKVRVLTVSGEKTTVVLSGLTIRDGFVKAKEARGGGILDIEDAKLTIEDAVLSGNRVQGEAGGEEKKALATGGAIDADGPLVLRDVTVSGNEASANGGPGEPGGQADGGGIQASWVSLADVRLEEDASVAKGGAGGEGGDAGAGALNSNPAEEETMSLTDVYMHANLADGTAGTGGAGGTADAGAMHIHSKGPAVDIEGLTASDNTAIAGGSAASAANATAGAIELKGDLRPVEIRNSTFTENVADALGPGGKAEAGGVYVSANKEPVTLDGDTVDANRAEGAALAWGGDIVFDGGVRVQETILSGGTGGEGHTNCYAVDPVESLGHNLDGDGDCSLKGPGDKVGEPGLGPLQGNGGPLPTQAIGAASPAHDGGAASGCAPTDERGAIRPQGAACDIGAFELAPPSVATGSASSIGQTSAKLTATELDPGPAATVGFQYGTTTLYAGAVSAGETEAGFLNVSGLISPAPAITPPPARTFAVVLTGLRAGTKYHYRAVTISSDGSAVGADATFTTEALNCRCLPPTFTGPLLSSLALSPSRIRPLRGLGASISARRGATLSYAVREAARTTFVVQRVLRGYVVGRACALRAPRRHARHPRRCSRDVTLGSFAHASRVHLVRLRFTGRLNGRALSPGRYRLVALARSGGGGGATGRAAIGFTIL
jgi:hypothetical protein